jgi:hypothetical protein
MYVTHSAAEMLDSYTLPEFFPFQTSSIWRHFVYFALFQRMHAICCRWLLSYVPPTTWMLSPILILIFLYSHRFCYTTFKNFPSFCSRILFLLLSFPQFFPAISFSFSNASPSVRVSSRTSFRFVLFHNRRIFTRVYEIRCSNLCE